MARVAIFAAALLALGGCDKRDAPKPESTAPPASASAATSALGSLKLTMNGLAQTVSVDGAAMFDMDDGVGVNLITNCPGAPSGCGVAPNGGPVTPMAYGCPQGKFVMLHFHAPRAKLAPGKYTQNGAVESSVSMIWLESGNLQLSADNWTDDVCTLQTVDGKQVVGTIDARFTDGSLAIQGGFTVPICAQ